MIYQEILKHLVKNALLVICTLGEGFTGFVQREADFFFFFLLTIPSVFLKYLKCRIPILSIQCSLPFISSISPKIIAYIIQSITLHIAHVKATCLLKIQQPVFCFSSSLVLSPPQHSVRVRVRVRGLTVPECSISGHPLFYTPLFTQQRYRYVVVNHFCI